MLFEFPYTPKPEDLEKLLQLLPTVEPPAGKADSRFIKSLGFSISSSNHLYNILKQLGFIDASDNAANVWKDYYANEQRRRVLALGIKQAYAELFERVMCPYLEADDSLHDFLKNRTEASEKEIGMMLETFRILNDFADYSDFLDDSGFNGLLPTTTSEKKEPKIKVDPNLQVNIQVLIDPDTSDEKVETIFKNMRKYLLDKQS